MLKLFAKNMMFVFLLVVASSQLVRAEVKNYQYDGKLPFVQMMLNMMAAMGIIDRIPVNGNYGSYGRNGRYGASPYSRSSWSQPGYGGYNLQSSPWGSPTWGVLPPESYALDGWVNESWETSQWNPQRQTQQYSTVVPQQNNVYQQSQNVPVQQNQSPQIQSPQIQPPQNYSPLARIAQPNQHGVQPDAGEYGRQSSRQSNGPSNNQIKQKPCITEFCGLKKPNLNGLWVSQNGEMLGIKANTYLWSDGDSRHLTGKIKVENEYLVTSVEGHEQLLRFKYKLSGNNLLTMQPNGEIREFVRMSANQYQNYNQNYEYNQNQGYSNPEYQQNYFGGYN